MSTRDDTRRGITGNGAELDRRKFLADVADRASVSPATGMEAGALLPGAARATASSTAARGIC